ncbi:MAG: YncE family protein, partial [Bryobacterales bacterium]|nr:YncE family protein [Bryobacterales bacterium]
VMRSLAVALLALAPAAFAAHPGPPGKVVKGLERLLYVTNKSGISVYDINDGHRHLRDIALPDTGVYKGISASVALGHLQLTSNLKDDILAIDLATDKVVWKKPYENLYPDSQAITPDGKTLYVPLRAIDSWAVIDAATGSEKGRIKVAHGENYKTDNHPIGGVGPHNTWMNPAGTRVYFEVLTEPWVWVADTKTNQLLGKIGPFGKGIRPFCVDDKEQYVYTNVDWLLGFEVGAVKDAASGKWGGKMLHRVEHKTPAARLAQIPNPPARKPHSTPSHGINIMPDQKEVWFVDGVYGYLYVYDVTKMPPRHVADIPLFKDPAEQPHPGWVSFSIDGAYAYPDGGAVIDTRTKQVVARIPTSEKLIEIDFRNGKPVRAGHR